MIMIIVLLYNYLKSLLEVRNLYEPNSELINETIKKLTFVFIFSFLLLTLAFSLLCSLCIF
jgi:hypothetical protein